MELLEEISKEIFSDVEKEDCPFDCDCKCSAKNKLEREQNLAGQMSSGKSTILFEKDGINVNSVEKFVDPVLIPKPKKENDFNDFVSWNAHHLIPIGSLMKSSLVRWMDKGVTGHQVLCDVGYDINGAENLKWLISNEKLSSYTKSIEEGKELKKKIDDLGNEKSNYVLLSKNAKKKKRVSIEIINESTLRDVIFGMMENYELQFHDAHHGKGGYNDFVKKILNKIKINYVKRYYSCENCTRKNKEKPNAPHELVERLNSLSDRLSVLLQGKPTGWRNPVYTSYFCKMFKE